MAQKYSRLRTTYQAVLETLDGTGKDGFAKLQAAEKKLQGLQKKCEGLETVAKALHKKPDAAMKAGTLKTAKDSAAKLPPSERVLNFWRVGV